MTRLPRTVLRLVLSAGLLTVILLVVIVVYFALLLRVPVVLAVTVGGGLVVVLLAAWGIKRIWRGSRSASPTASGNGLRILQGNQDPESIVSQPKTANDDLWTQVLAANRDFSPAELFEFQNELALRNAAGLAAQRGGEAEPTHEDIAGGRSALDTAREKAGTVQQKLAEAIKRWDAEYTRTGMKDGPASRDVSEFSQMYEF